MGADVEGHVYEKGVRIWVPDPDIVWISAKITSVDGANIKCTDDNGKEHVLKVADKPFLRNPPLLEDSDDLTHLSYLHEPAVLNTLRTRYSMMNIYTYCGIVLVAINPFQALDIYTDDLIREYHGKVMGDLEPHLFALAEEAYSNMSKLGKDQSIVVSGESGAGKTVSAKYTMRYFATVGGSGGDRQMEKQVMASNPVMEAFGNAKTTRNNNSSRFGKYIAIQFDKNFAIAGALMMTYLLEKSRVVFQSEDERGYHIFYQLCAAIWENCPPEFEDLKLSQCQNYHYINQGKCPTVDRVNDAEDFEETRRSLQLVGIGNELQLGMFRVLAAILHLGNVEITSRRTEDAQLKEDDEALATACRLLDIPVAEALKWLTKRKITVGKDIVIKTMTKDQAISVRDAFAKYLYASIFDWIVAKVNSVLANGNHKGRFIGVLDIYGFELFDTNSFEQFCINYANEKLQQQFNQHVFKLEQEEYIREQIQWSFIDFYDNQPCIDLIEDKLGVLSLLDEEARLPKGADQSFLEKLKSNHGKKDHFSLPRFGNNLFVIHHFAAKVTYTVDGFLDKNKDAVAEELTDLLVKSKVTFVQELFGPSSIVAKQHEASQKGGAGGQGTAKAKAATVGSQFKQSLQALMETIYSTTPHYCRCLKPNQAKEPFLFEEKNMIEQLRACGVLETIRISAAGYPSRNFYDDFRERYSLLLRSKERKTHDTRELCKIILTKVINDEDKYQFGINKIFFRAGQVAYLEKLRSDRMKEAILMMQKHVRGYLARQTYTRTLVAARLLQRLARGFLARQAVQGMREHHAAVLMQKYLRRWRLQKAYVKLRTDLVALQCAIRKHFAMQEYERLRREKAATKIQSVMRMHLARKNYKWARRAVIIVQNLERRRRARNELKTLKLAERDVSALKEKNWGLENKVMELQRRLDEANSELKRTRAEAAQAGMAKEIEVQLNNTRKEKDSLAQQLANAESEMKNAAAAAAAVAAQMAERDGQLAEEKKIAEDLRRREKELEVLLAQAEEDKAALNASVLETKARVEQLQKQAQKAEKREKKQATMTVLSGAQDIQGSPIPSPRASFAAQSMSFDAPPSNENLSRLGAENNDLLSKLDEATKAKESAVRELETKSQREATMATELALMQEQLASIQADKEKADREIQSLNELLQSLSRPQAGDAAGDGGVLAQAIQDAVKSNAAKEAADAELRRIAAELQRVQEERDRAMDLTRELESELAVKTKALTEAETAQAMAGVSAGVAGLTGGVAAGGGAGAGAGAGVGGVAEAGAGAVVVDERKEAEIVELRAQLAKMQREVENTRRTSVGVVDHALQDEIRRLREENAALLKRLKERDAMYSEQDMTPRRSASISSKPLDYHRDLTRQASVGSERGEEMVVDMGDDQGFMGMFAFDERDERLVIQELILNADPKKMAGELPGAIAYVIFMCIKWADYVNNAKQLQSLLTNSISTIKHVVMKNSANLELLGFWLSNSNVLLNSMHYSEELVDENCDYELENFDLTEYRQVLEDLAAQMYYAIVRHVQDELSKIVVPAILENDLLQGVMSGGNINNKKSKTRGGKTKTVHDVTAVLADLYKTLNDNYVDPELTQQVFVQLAYFISATCLNNLLLRKDLCNWSKGLQIQFNVSHLEGWLRDNKLESAKIRLVAIAQATKLLQMPKHTMEDIEPIMNTCTDLNYMQIQKILTMYTPDAVEERVPVSVIREIEKVGRRRDAMQNRGAKPALMLDLTAIKPPQIMFSNPTQKLSQVQVPTCMKLDFLEKK